jgi:hypothetical protein
MIRLTIDLNDLIDALTLRFELGEAQHFLDLETGEIVLVSDEVGEPPEDIEDGTRYRPIDPIESHESYQIMEDFVESLPESKLKNRLGRALDGRKPFRHFKDTLLDFPDTREAWFQFEHRAHERLAEAWCRDNGIEAEWKKPGG